MTTQTEALKLALDFVEDVYLGEWRGPTERQEEVISAIKEALAQPEQEPVAKVCHDLDGHIGWNPKLTQLPDEGTLLYTTPPQRTWVGLTDEEIEACFHHVDEAGIGLFDFAEAIEAKLKEKNA